MNLQLLNVDLPLIHTPMFEVTVNSNISHFQPSFCAFHISLILALTAMKNTRNIHAVSTN